jgi:hypothetical protein
MGRAHGDRAFNRGLHIPGSATQWNDRKPRARPIRRPERDHAITTARILTLSELPGLEVHTGGKPVRSILPELDILMRSA